MTKWRLPGFRLRAVPVALAALTVVIMVAMGHHIVSQFRATLLNTYAEIVEIHANEFLEPYASAFARNGTAVQPQLANLETAVARHLSQPPAIVLQIRQLDGRLIYSSDPGPSTWSGSFDARRVPQIETVSQAKGVSPLPLPYLEIYVPILDPDKGTPVAVAKLYVDAREIAADANVFEHRVRLAIGIAMLAVIAMLAFSARQSEELRARLKAEQVLVDQNRTLRLEAEQARLDAAQANEQTLNFVGAEIHDGPVQLLSLASLMAGGPGPAAPAGDRSPASLIGQAVADLRRISAGLILPELEPLDLMQVVSLAVRQHCALTGASVAFDCDRAGPIPSLSMPLRTCIFRVVQEGLTNATRHGGAGPVTLGLALNDLLLVITVESGDAPQKPAAAAEIGQKLGLHGMKRRLGAFNGHATLHRNGMRPVLEVTLPLGA